MAGNSIGTLLRLTTFGESHGKLMGGVLDGLPAGIIPDFDYVSHQLMRRATAGSFYASQRKEPDEVEYVSGLFEGKTTGAPLAFLVRNHDQHSADYDHLRDVFRPGHADVTYQMKYGIRDHRGGGRASARETISWVVAGSLVGSWLRAQGIRITGFVSAIGDISMKEEPAQVEAVDVLVSDVGCPDHDTSAMMIQRLHEVADAGDTLGGVITVLIDGVPPGLGDPVFDKFQADMGKACLNLNAVKGFEIGEGFRSASMLGSEYKDIFSGLDANGRPLFQSNRAGGILGGITTGQQIRFRVAFKPISSTRLPSPVIDAKGTTKQTAIAGRHDVCPVPRAVPILESLASLVLADHLLRQSVGGQLGVRN